MPNLKLTKIQRELAEYLFLVGAVKFGSFPLKLHETDPGAPKSPVYLNLRTPDNPNPGPLSAEDVKRVGLDLLSSAQRLGLKFRHIAGIPNAGDPLAYAMSRWPDHALSLITLEKGMIGKRRTIARIKSGDYRVGETVLLIDDVITRADTKFEAIRVLEAAGLKVHDLLVVIDREQGGRGRLEEQGYNVHTILTLTQLLDVSVAQKKITAGKRREVLEYIAVNRI